MYFSSFYCICITANKSYIYRLPSALTIVFTVWAGHLCVSWHGLECCQDWGNVNFHIA